MRAAGIDDLLVFERGAHAQRISLGVYRDRQQAEAHVARLHSLGFATDLVAQGTGTRDQFWLDVELAEGVVLAEAVGSLPPDVDTSAVACDSVMAARE